MKKKYGSVSDGKSVIQERGHFINTAVPRFDGTGCWQQHLQFVQAIVKSNGWSEGTAALQLFAHLDGEAMNVALLIPKGEREKWEGLSNGLSEYYNSPGRLAVVRRRFESAIRRPGMDPATFSTELGILTARGFGDMGKHARDAMIRDKFIAAQRHCGLWRHLDGVPPATPIWEIVNSCRVWKSVEECFGLVGVCGCQNSGKAVVHFRSEDVLGWKKWSTGFPQKKGMQLSWGPLARRHHGF